LATLFFVLGIPLLGSVVLALSGHRDAGREINVAFSLGTFVATCALTTEVIAGGPLFAWNREFYIDPLNVFLVTLTAFVGLTTVGVLTPLHAHRTRPRQDDAESRLRLYHSMYQLFGFTMLLALTTNNLGIIWVAMEAATLTTVLLVSVYRTRSQPGGRLEVFHPVWSRHRPGACSERYCYIWRRPKVIGTAGWSAALDQSRMSSRISSTPTIITLAFRVPVHRVWHQGRIGAGAQLAARRACRRPDAGVSRVVGPAAERGLVCRAALQGADRRRA
jgi:hydrogenase-4 component F